MQRVDETDRNPITPGVTQFHWNRIDHNQHDSWWSLAPTATHTQKNAGCLAWFFITSSTHIVSLAFRMA